MPPKSNKAAAANKKAEEKKKIKIAEDKTFGLKNKNKSAKIQKFVQQVQTQATVKNTKEDIAKQKAKEEKAKKKAEEEAYKAELAKLFVDANAKKPKEKPKDEEGESSGPFKSSAENEDYLWQPEDFEYEKDEQSLEEQLEAERVALREKMETEGGGIPVTAESFAIWKEKKRLAAEKEKKKKIKTFKKTGGGLSGRQLFEIDASLFKDMDEDACEAYVREEEPEEGEGASSKGGGRGASSTGGSSAGGDVKVDESLFEDLEIGDEDEDEEGEGDGEASSSS